MTTSTLRYTSRRPTVGDHMARVAAAGRVMAERQAEQAERERIQRLARASANQIICDLRDDGAVRIGFKVCWDSGWKQREVFPIEDGMARDLLVRTYGADAEVWGIREDGTYCSEVF